MTAQAVDILVAAIVVAGIFVLARPGSPAVGVLTAIIDTTVSAVRTAVGSGT